MKKSLVLTLLFCLQCIMYAQEMSPNGYYVSGNKVYDQYNKQILFKGVNRPSMEWNAAGQKLVQADIKTIAKSCANIIRLPLNQDFWLKNTSNYQSTVDSVIKWCMTENMNVILDLHWSQKNDVNTTAAQQNMADEISLNFWYQVASKYKNNGKVLFELYNEPHDITWSQLLNGGINTNGTISTSDDWKMVGYQQLYDTVRASGAKNLIIVGGTNWTFDLSYYETNPIDGYNIMYATHCYPYSNKLSNNWYHWTKIAKNYPVFATEFGPNALLTTNYVQEVIDTLYKLDGHFTAWGWWHFASGNSIWNSFNPSTNQYDTTFYGKWYYDVLKNRCASLQVSGIIKNQLVSNPLLISALPVDAVNVDSVVFDFKNAGSTIYKVRDSDSPYNVSFDPESRTPGNYTLQVIVFSKGKIILIDVIAFSIEIPLSLDLNGISNFQEGFTDGKEMIWHPNPTSSILIHTNVGSNEIERVELYQSNGNCIEVFTEGFEQLDLQNFTPGLYFIKTYTIEKLLMQTIMVQ